MRHADWAHLAFPGDGEMARGYWEETYWTYSYSPLHDDDGRVRGVFTAVTESTEQVVGAGWPSCRTSGRRPDADAASPKSVRW